MGYAQHVSRLMTPQTESARPDQVKNNAGGYTFQIDKWGQLDRFLVLGSAGGTYYVSERKLTRQNAAVVEECLKEDAVRTISRIVEISESGRAPKNDPAIFALAIAASSPHPETRRHALASLSSVCRIGTHLFHFAEDVKHLRKWSRGLRTAVARWYTERSATTLAYQVAKYQQRDGWSHRDLLRLSHATPKTDGHGAVFRWVVGGGSEALDTPTKRGGVIDKAHLPVLLTAIEELRTASVKRAVELIREHNIPHECVPNEMKDEPEVWEAMLDGMGLTALIRNLGKLSAVGLIAPLTKSSNLAIEKLTNRDELKKQRVHPFSVLLAAVTYRAGRGVKGSLTWTAHQPIIDALDEAFYASFDTVTPTGLSHMLALDVSGSMGPGYGSIANSFLSARDASAAMALVTAKTEKKHAFYAFSGGMKPLAISPKMNLASAVRVVSNLPFDRTDCSLPMQFATANKLDVDVFTVYTDNETWAGSMHPFQALRAYRQKSGRAAKLIVVGMTATEFTIADPNDAGMLDVVGFDAAAPQIMSDFACAKM